MVLNKPAGSPYTEGVMALFNQQDGSYEVIQEGDERILKIDYEDVPRIPSIEDDPSAMSRIIDLLVENPNTTKIVFIQRREYEYDFTQTQMLQEIALLYKKLVRNKDIFDQAQLAGGGVKQYEDKIITEVQELVFQKLKTDPIGCYVELKRLERRERIQLEEAYGDEQAMHERYQELLTYLLSRLENTRLITLAQPYLAGHHVGDRDVYRKIFAPVVKPDFMYTKLMAAYPQDATELDSYIVDDIEVTIFELDDDVQYLYHVTPPEFKLVEEKYEILDMARNIMAEHKPSRQEFVDPHRMRQVFRDVGRDLLEELTEYKEMDLEAEEIDELTDILIRYTVGFGLIEVLLRDKKIQDITINSPTGKIPMFLVHQDYGECRTNIIPSVSDTESWATKLRLISGRPLDEANPVLDTEITIPNIAKARVGVITEPLNPQGQAYAFRRHRDKPWTLPLFIKEKMVTPLAAGLLSFIVDGNRTMLIAGTRSAGKTSLLGSLLVEIMRKYRIITIEDTLELPTDSLRKLGYNIQPMKVAGALSQGSAEVPADQGIRTTLRMGDSALIVGEVRSKEARALYEAMRVGALANVVAGTIHGDSPYGVFDRVVNDLEVPRTSFKATDIIVVANPIRSADGLSKNRRVTQISEVRKDWEDDPVEEGGFVDLMRYNSETDRLEPTDELINGNSDILKSIAGNVREWAGDWPAVWDNIQLRADIKEALVDAAEEENDPEMLEAEFVIKANDQFHRISDQVKQKTGELDTDRILFEWKEWLKRAVRKRNM